MGLLNGRHARGSLKEVAIMIYLGLQEERFPFSWMLHAIITRWMTALWAAYSYFRHLEQKTYLLSYTLKLQKLI